MSTHICTRHASRKENMYGQLEDGHDDMRHRWYFEINEINERCCVYTAENVDTTLRVKYIRSFVVTLTNVGQFSQFFYCHTP